MNQSTRSDLIHRGHVTRTQLENYDFLRGCGESVESAMSRTGLTPAKMQNLASVQRRRERGE